MKSTAFELWSSGLEAWEPVELGKVSPPPRMVQLHRKHVNERLYVIARDELNRYFRWEVDVELGTGDCEPLEDVR